MRWADGVAGKEDAGDEYQGDEDVGHREDGPVHQAQYRPLASARCHIVGVRGTIGELCEPQP